MIVPFQRNTQNAPLAPKVDPTYIAMAAAMMRQEDAARLAPVKPGKGTDSGASQS